MMTTIIIIIIIRSLVRMSCFVRWFPFIHPVRNVCYAGRDGEVNFDDNKSPALRYCRMMASGFPEVT